MLCRRSVRLPLVRAQPLRCHATAPPKLQAERVTLALIKPDIVHEPEDQRKIFEHIEKNGFKILGGGRPLLWGRASAERFYAEHRGRFFYQRLIAFMTSAPIIPMVLERHNAVIEWRKLMGPTHIRRSRTEVPESIRGQMAKSDTRNCVHGSDSVETALREIALFWPTLQIEPLGKHK